MSGEVHELGVALGRGTRRTHFSFFFCAHVVLLVIVLAGFSPTFYLRSAFTTSRGFRPCFTCTARVLTVWFLLAVVQGWLIRTQTTTIAPAARIRCGRSCGDRHRVRHPRESNVDLRDRLARRWGEHRRLGKLLHPGDVCSVHIARCRLSQKAAGAQTTHIARIDVYCRTGPGTSSEVAHIRGRVGSGKKLCDRRIADHVCFCCSRMTWSRGRSRIRRAGSGWWGSDQSCRCRVSRRYRHRVSHPPWVGTQADCSPLQGRPRYRALLRSGFALTQFS